MTIQEIYDRLDKQCQYSLNSISYVNKTEYLVNDEMKRIRDLVIKQSFLSVFTEWEHFLEDTTVAYALGEKSILGFMPDRYIFPLDSDHADQLIKGVSAYPDWSKIEDVKKLEKAFFKDGEPFVSALNGFSSLYKNMQKVRNFIVHNSIKSREDFESLVRGVLSASKVGISPSEFLLSKKASNPMFYKLYITHIRNAATLISKYQP